MFSFSRSNEISENVDERINLQKALFELEDITLENRNELEQIEASIERAESGETSQEEDLETLKVLGFGFEIVSSYYASKSSYNGRKVHESKYTAVQEPFVRTSGVSFEALNSLYFKTASEIGSLKPILIEKRLLILRFPNQLT